MAEPVLDVSTLIERPKIAIDQVIYDIRAPDELSVLDHHRVAAQGKRLDELFGQPTLTDIEQSELSKLVRELADFIMVGVPAEVRASLTDSQRMDVAQVFTVLPLQKHLKAAAAAMTKSTGATRPRGSKDSTAARRTGGSKKRRSHSSGPTS